MAFFVGVAIFAALAVVAELLFGGPASGDRTELF